MEIFFISPAIHTTLSPSREYAPNLRTKSNLLSPSLNFAPSHGSHASLFLCKAMHRVSLHISLFSTFWLAFRQLPHHPPATCLFSVLALGLGPQRRARCTTLPDRERYEERHTHTLTQTTDLSMSSPACALPRLHDIVRPRAASISDELPRTNQRDNRA